MQSKVSLIVAGFLFGFAAHSFLSPSTVEAQGTPAPLAVCGTQLYAGMSQKAALSAVSAGCVATKLETNAAVSDDAFSESYMLKPSTKGRLGGNLGFKNGVLKIASRDWWNAPTSEPTGQSVAALLSALRGSFGPSKLVLMKLDTQEYPGGPDEMLILASEERQVVVYLDRAENTLQVQESLSLPARH